MLKNDLLLQALRGESLERPPVWMMRQAGRYLKEYQALRAKYDFFTRVKNPDLASDITIQPIDSLDMDAAILFSDILVIPQAMGLEVQMIENKGPFLPKTIQNKADIDALKINEAVKNLHFVFDAITVSKEKLNNRVPLIGFAGAPFTILCYMIEGKGSKNFDKAKAFCFTKRELAHELLQKITKLTILYLKEQIKSGVDVVQIFDSWSGLLSPADFNEFSETYLLQISNELSDLAPIILFPKGSWYALEKLSHSKASAIGIDWTISAKFARECTQNRITIQGNYDPCKLYQAPDLIKKDVHQLISDFGKDKLIVNLGHGILPDIPLKNAKAFVNAVKTYKETR
jgi:uroporphyrinogen decarboxylase